MKAAIVCVTGMGLATSACGQASASGFDPANPLHCAAQMESYSVVARLQGDQRGERGWGARAQWYVDRARSSQPADQFSDAALLELGNKIAAAPDRGLALATECVKRQDADSEYQRLLGKS